MWRKSLVCLCLLLTAAAPAAFCQDAEMFQVYTMHVQWGEQQHYASVLPGLWDAFERAGIAFPVFVSSGVSDPATFNLVSPFAAFSELDGRQAAVEKAVAAATGVVAELQGLTTSVDRSLWIMRPDLSYSPQTPRLKPAEATFTRGVFLYPHPDKAEAVAALIKEGSDMRKKHGLGDGTNVAQLVIGDGGPAFVVMVDARNEADLYAQAAKASEKMGEEWQAFLTKLGPMLRKLEFQSWTNRLDLSYQP